MKVIRNLTRVPLKVPLGQAKFLHLGPGQSGSVADDAPELPAMAKMIKEKKLEVVGADDASVGEVSVGGAPREFSHGHGHPTRIFPKGNRGG